MFEKPEGAEADAAAAAAGSGSSELQTDTTATAIATAPASNADADPDAGPGSSEAAEQPSSGVAADAPQSNGRARGKSRNKKRGRSPGSSRKQAMRVRIDEFPVASQLICSLMPLLRQELLGSDTLREKLFQVNFHTTLSKQGMITLLYHKQVSEAPGWHTAACKLHYSSLTDSQAGKQAHRQQLQLCSALIGCCSMTAWAVKSHRYRMHVQQCPLGPGVVVWQQWTTTQQEVVDTHMWLSASCTL